MKPIHLPRVDARYWLGILLASIFGTNTGDLYARESGLGLGLGLLLLAALAVVVFLLERRSGRPGERYYWLVIIIIRTGATNVADLLAFIVRIPGLPLALGLAALIALFAWRQHAVGRRAGMVAQGERLTGAGSAYWAAMLAAGVFGTVVGDIAQHGVGQDLATVGLVVLLATLLAIRGTGAWTVASYWATVAFARTAGTAIGDWLAENKFLALGLPWATLLSGTVFVMLLLSLWRTRLATVTRR